MIAKLVKGANLTPRQRAEVLAGFPYRWTVENRVRAHAFYRGQVPTIAPTTDDEFVRTHAFYIRKNGHLASRPAHCEPVYLADVEGIDFVKREEVDTDPHGFTAGDTVRFVPEDRTYVIVRIFRETMKEFTGYRIEATDGYKRINADHTKFESLP